MSDVVALRILDTLRVAEALSAALASARNPVKLWEAFAAADSDPALARNEVRRLSALPRERRAGAASAEMLLALALNHPKHADFMRALRRRLPPFPRTREDLERTETLLALAVLSPVVREAAMRWDAAPDRHAEEIVRKLSSMETVADAYRTALRSLPPEAAPAPAPPPRPRVATPARLSAAPGDRHVALSWDPVPGATGYVVRRRRTGFPAETVATPASPAHTDSGLENGKTYLYAVRARTAEDESGDSDPVQVVPAGPPVEPGAPRAAAGNGQVVLSWDPVKGAVRYVVRRAERGSGPFNPVGTPAAPLFVDAGLENGRDYQYTVAAAGPGGEGAASPAATATPVAPPAAPACLEARAGDGHVALSWTPVPGASTYTLRRSTNPHGPFAAVASSSAPSFLDAGITNGTTYHYVVHGVNPGGEGAASDPASAMPLAPPGVPAAFSAVPGHGVVRLRWLAAPGAATYRIALDGAPLAETAELAFEDASAGNDRPRRYTLVAANASGDSAPAGPVDATPRTPPSAPARFVAEPGDGRVALRWDPAPRAESYRVLRADLARPLAEVTEPFYTDLSAENGRSHGYSIRALNCGGESPATATAAATPLAPPVAPAGFAAEAADGSVTLRWDPVPGALRYRLRRATQAAGPYSAVATPEGAAYVDRAVENGNTYHYLVAAVNAVSEGARSRRAEASPVAPPDAPANLAARPGNASVSLRWDASPRASQYRVYRDGASVALTSRTSHEDAGLANGAACRYEIVALNAGGESAPCEAATATPVAPPAAPEALTATPGNARVTLLWTESAGAESYVVARARRARGPFEAVASGLSATLYTDENLPNDAEVHYVVAAVNAGGESPRSPAASATPVAPPTARTGLRAIPGDETVSLAWSASARATHYVVKRSLAPQGSYTPVASPAGASHFDAQLENGRTYYYVVVAVNPGGESPDSAAVACTPRARPARTAAPTPLPMAGTKRSRREAEVVGPEAEVVDVEAELAPAPGGVLLATEETPLPQRRALPPGVDLERLLDLRNVTRLRDVYAGTAQKIEIWEALTLFQEEGHPVRREVESLLRARREGDAAAFEEGAAGLFDRILRVRAAGNALVRTLREYAHEMLARGDAGELALAFVVSAPKGRRRAECWIAEPAAYRSQAGAYLAHAETIAARYLEALEKP